MTKIITASEFMRDVERYQGEAKDGPISITRDGRADTVLVSAEMFDILLKGRIARSVAELDDATIDAIRQSSVAAEHAHLDALLDDWTP